MNYRSVDVAKSIGFEYDNDNVHANGSGCNDKDGDLRLRGKIHHVQYIHLVA